MRRAKQIADIHRLGDSLHTYTEISPHERDLAHLILRRQAPPLNGASQDVTLAALHEPGLGVALKCEDSSSRASEAMMTAILLRLGVVNPDELRSIDRLLPQPKFNRNRRAVGELQVTGALLDS